jgi:hypothetical protein
MGGALEQGSGDLAHDVFISHSSKDKLVADAICGSLEAHGIRCWIAPRDIMPGATWGDAIISAISRCRCMVVVLSSGSNDSPQVLREVERGISKGLVVVPFRIEDVSPSGALEFFLSAPHWLDALTPPLEQHLGKLVKTITLLLQTHEDAPSDPTEAGSASDHREPERKLTHPRPTRVVIFNASSPLTHLLSGTIEVEFDGRYLGRLRRQEYLEADLEEGEHRLSLRHRDAKYWETTQNVAIQGEAVYLKVFATTKADAFEIVSALPTFFRRKFRRATPSGDDS